MDTSRLAANRPLVSTCLAAALLVGCGGEGTDKESSEPAVDSSSKASSSPESAVDASTLAVPSGGPEKIKSFAIPRGAKIVDAGPAFNMSWTFGISSPDTATVLAFYKKALTDGGYTIEEKVTPTTNANVEFDLAFYGKTYGVVDASELTGGTQVTVNDRPVRGLEPQP